MGRYSNYWGGYYPPRSTPIKVNNGLKLKSRRGEIGDHWWSQRWIEVLESFRMGARLDRGKSYARQGQVLSVEIQEGQVTAKVQGSQRTPYKVQIDLPPLSEDAWHHVIDIMASQAIFAAKLLCGEMPQTIEEAFATAGVQLFPCKKNDLKTDCSCPDSANPCKHIAAVYLILAEKFDDDPFLIFKLRGRDKEQLITDLRARRTGISPSAEEGGKCQSPQQPAEREDLLGQGVDYFWKGDPVLFSTSINMHPPTVPHAFLKRLGASPLEFRGKNFSDVLENIYDAVRAKIKRDFLDLAQESRMNSGATRQGDAS